MRLQSPPPLSAVEIYDRARSAAAARRAPPFVAYTQSATFVRHGRSRVRQERIVVRTADGKTNITPLAGPPAEARVEDRPLVFRRRPSVWCRGRPVRNHRRSRTTFPPPTPDRR